MTLTCWHTLGKFCVCVTKTNIMERLHTWLTSVFTKIQFYWLIGIEDNDIECRTVVCEETSYSHDTMDMIPCDWWQLIERFAVPGDWQALTVILVFGSCGMVSTESFYAPSVICYGLVTPLSLTLVCSNRCFIVYI